MSETALHYTSVIQWSDEDCVYVVSLPEWGDLIHTHGDTYEEALQHGRELLDLLVQSRGERGEALPAPRVFA
jgi:antitoxin HicB